MNIKVVKESITVDELKEIAKEFYYPLVKGAVDIKKEIAVFGGEYHIDASEVLFKEGSKQKNIWGFNIQLDKEKTASDWIEYVALINIKPSQNPSMEIKSEEIRQKIRAVLTKLIIT